jgi:hypothetical protein
MVPGNRRKPIEGESHRTIATTSYQKRNPEPGRHDDDTQPIQIQIG